MSDGRQLPSGTYEHLVTNGLDRQLSRVAEHLVQRRGLDAADAHEVLTRHIAALTRRALRSVAGNDAADLARQVDLANRICAAIADITPKATSTDEAIASSRDLLLAIMRPSARPGAVRFPDRPHIALTSSALLVNGRDQPRVGREVGLELATADRVDLLCAFVKWSGLRIVEPALREFRHRGGQLRVLTTTYTGATERRALDRLVELGAEVRVSYETRTTRLHAKAWLFRRDNGLDTAYVGSSNLSRAALVDGVEWNVRLTAAEQPHLLDTFAATFEDYWNDPGVESYNPNHDRLRLDYALASERGGPVTTPVDIAMLDVRPFGYQGEVLDELEAGRRVHSQWKNLVVMATGTGKTVVAALDYRRLHRSHDVETLLYIAHREEIIRQSLSTFRQVMHDGAFGELAVAGKRPTQWRQVFASVQLMHRFDLDDIDPHSFDMVIVDEFHHAEAKTYTRLLEHLRPRVLLGLTATPERADGLDVTRWFGGQTAVELRLWEALERQLLVPFHYFAIHDDVSLENVRWRRGKGYDDAELDKIYTGNEARVRLILAAVADKVPDVGGMRAMGFCASIAHAKYMAERFTTCGVPACAITADSLSGERRAGLTDLAARRINIIFTVDLFNEGIDIPDIDTILLLRPTQSATIFLQQLGRGLRLADDKSVLTVLDFVGAQRAEFRFDLRFRALTGSTRRRLARDIAEGFPSLPSGCHIHLDPVAARIVLDNVRR